MINFAVTKAISGELSVEKTDLPAVGNSIFETYDEAKAQASVIAKEMFDYALKQVVTPLTKEDEDFLANYDDNTRYAPSDEFLWNEYVAIKRDRRDELRSTLLGGEVISPSLFLTLAERDTIRGRAIAAITPYNQLRVYSGNKFLKDTRYAGFGGHEFTFKSTIDGHIEKSNSSWNGTVLPKWLATLVLRERDKYAIWEELIEGNSLDSTH